MLGASFVVSFVLPSFFLLPTSTSSYNHPASTPPIQIEIAAEFCLVWHDTEANVDPHLCSLLFFLSTQQINNRDE